MMTNSMRLDQLEYEKETPVIKESRILFFEFPNLQQVRTFSIKETILEREDNLLMAIEAVTGDEDNFF